MSALVRFFQDGGAFMYPILFVFAFDGNCHAVDTSAEIDERESLESSVPSAVLAAAITRREVGNQVIDEMLLDRTEITGNQELPKVLYIVPWKKSDPGDLIGRPVNTLLDEVLAPLDREEFIRQVDYYGDLYGDGE